MQQQQKRAKMMAPKITEAMANACDMINTLVNPHIGHQM